MADSIFKLEQVQSVGTDRDPQTGQAVLNLDVNRVRLLGSDSAGAGAASVTIAAVTGKSICITKIIGTAASTPTGELVITEDLGQADANVLISIHPVTTDENIDFNPPLKGSLVGKAITASWTTGGSVATDLLVYGFFE